MSKRKGIVLAGGAGTRLDPLTVVVSKQLLPVYDKPMIYYPICTLMIAGIRDILIITTNEDQRTFMKLLGDGSQWGISISYETQQSPNGLAEAYIIGEKFLKGSPSVMILGDNIFIGDDLLHAFQRASLNLRNGTIFGCDVADPSRFGVAEFNDDGSLERLVEKPRKPPSSYAVVGIYFLDGDAPSRAKNVQPSFRGELEIVDLLMSYIKSGTLVFEKLDKPINWSDVGTPDSLLNAANYVRTVQNSQNDLFGSPDKVAYQSGWITTNQLCNTIKILPKTEYRQRLKTLL